MTDKQKQRNVTPQEDAVLRAAASGTLIAKGRMAAPAQEATGEDAAIYKAIADNYRPTAKEPAPAQRLNENDVWVNSAIMVANADAGLQMPVLMQLVRAVEAAVCPPGYVVVKADFDVTECIHAGYRLHQYAQGTGPAVAFYRGAKWLASTATAPKGNT